MGFDLGGLGKLIDPGAMAHQLVDSFLPKDLQWVGGLVGAAVDYECGNIPGAISQGASALSDLKDTPQSSSQAIASNAPKATSTGPANQNQNWSYEPSPPPARTTTISTTTTTSSSTPPTKAPATGATIGQFGANVEQLKHNASQPTTTTTTTTTTTASSSTQDTKAPSTDHFSAMLKAVEDQMQKSASRSTTTSTTTTTTSSSNSSGVTSAQQGLKTDAVPSQGAPSGAPPAGAASSSSAANATNSTSSAGISDGVKKLLALSNDDLQRAISSGNIPKDLSNSDMLALQTRMNQISQMNQLMTQMISAMHDMQMAVARNIHA